MHYASATVNHDISPHPWHLQGKVILPTKHSPASYSRLSCPSSHTALIPLSNSSLLTAGGHINPAVTIAFVASNKISVIRGACYIVMQVSTIVQICLHACTPGLELRP